MTDLPRIPAMNRRELERLYEGYRHGLEQMTMPELMAHATQLGAMIEQDRAGQLALLMRSASRSSLDDPVIPSTPMAIPSPAGPARPADRGGAASAQRSRPSSPLELLASSTRTGPRLAAKLILADARRRARREASE